MSYRKQPTVSMVTDVGPETWDTVDSWWDLFMETESVIGAPETTLDGRWQRGLWEQLDPWWESFNEVRRADAAELLEVLKTSNREWEQSESRFDADPLATDWTPHQDTRGPLRPNQEENWSQWLAHLFRSSSGELLGELFGDRFEVQPDAVRREVHLPDSSGADRYADIVLHWADRAISIEVKKDDEHYTKTAHTAGLLERYHDYEWHHVLLLPKYNEPVLQATFGEELEVREDGSVWLRSEQSGAISVVFWRDVSRAIRTVLLRGDEVDPHFEASAYLLCTLIEQQMLRLTPYPMVEQIVETDDVIHASRSLSMATGGVEEQITYLREVEAVTDE